MSECQQQNYRFDQAADNKVIILALDLVDLNSNTKSFNNIIYQFSLLFLISEKSIY